MVIPLGSRKSPTAHLCNRALQVVVRSVANQSAMQRTLLPMTAQYSPRCSWFEPELKVRRHDVSIVGGGRAPVVPNQVRLWALPSGQAWPLPVPFQP